MARAKALAKQRVRYLARMGVTPASQGLTEEGEPLPKAAAIDLSANDADDDADRGEEVKDAGKEPADGDPVPSGNESVRLPANPSKKKTAAKGTPEAIHRTR